MIAGWFTPYTFKRKFALRYWPWWRFYSIIFEDTEIMVLSEYDDVKRMTAALNGAYNLGRGRGHIEALETM